MPTFYVTEERAMWVKEFYAVEAENEDAAEKEFWEGEHKFLGHTVTDVLDHVETRFHSVQTNPPVVIHGCADDRKATKEAVTELLEACRAALFQFEHNGDESDSDREVLNQLQAAIAKAIGE